MIVQIKADEHELIRGLWLELFGLTHPQLGNMLG